DVDDGQEVLVAAAAGTHVAGVDAVLVERARRFRVVDQQLVAVVVEVPHQGHVEAHVVEAGADGGHGAGGGVVVDGDAHDLAAGPSQVGHLRGRAGGIGGVGVGHVLHHHRVTASDRHTADPRRRGGAPQGEVHRGSVYRRG